MRRAKLSSRCKCIHVPDTIQESALICRRSQVHKHHFELGVQLQDKSTKRIPPMPKDSDISDFVVGMASSPLTPTATLALEQDSSKDVASTTYPAETKKTSRQSQYQKGLKPLVNKVWIRRTTTTTGNQSTNPQTPRASLNSRWPI